MRIRRATAADIDGLARLLWLDTMDADPDPGSVAAFATDLTTWWVAHGDTHHAFIAQPSLLPTAQIHNKERQHARDA